jgi:hypothetical protein
MWWKLQPLSDIVPANIPVPYSLIQYVTKENIEHKIEVVKVVLKIIAFFSPVDL